MIHSKLIKKCKKNEKKCPRVLYGIQKKLFLHSQTTTTWGEQKERVVNRGMFIERMKECSKYSRERNLRFASDEARTDKNKRH